MCSGEDYLCDSTELAGESYQVFGVPGLERAELISGRARRWFAFPGDFEDFDDVKGRGVVPGADAQRPTSNVKDALAHVEEIGFIARQNPPFDFGQHAFL